MTTDQIRENGPVPDGSRTFVVTPRLRLSPDVAVVGREIAVVATGFPPGEAKILIDAEVARGETDARGTLYASFNVPPCPSGQYEVRAESNNGRAQLINGKIWAVLTVVPVLALSPSRGIGLTTVSGKGMAANSPVQLFAGEQELPLVPVGTVTDRCGSFTAIITMPSNRAGNYEITARTGDVTATATFTMVYPAEPEGV